MSKKISDEAYKEIADKACEYFKNCRVLTDDEVATMLARAIDMALADYFREHGSFEGLGVFDEK